MCSKAFIARRSLLRHLFAVHKRADYRELVPLKSPNYDLRNRFRHANGRFAKKGDESASDYVKKSRMDLGQTPRSGSDEAFTRKVVHPFEAQVLRSRPVVSQNFLTQGGTDHACVIRMREAKPMLPSQVLQQMLFRQEFMPVVNHPFLTMTPEYTILGYLQQHQQPRTRLG